MPIHRNLFEKRDLWYLSCPSLLSEIKTLYHTPVTIRQKYAEIRFDNLYALKTIYPQKAADAVRRLWNSQGYREAKGSRLLRSMGIATPKIYGWGFAIYSPSGFDSFILMQKITDSRPLRDYLNAADLSISFRHSLLSRVREDLQKMIMAGIYHKDAHFKNILLDQNTPIWIDNDIGKLNSYKKLQRFLHRFQTPEYLDVSERELFYEASFRHLFP